MVDRWQKKKSGRSGLGDIKISCNKKLSRREVLSNSGKAALASSIAAAGAMTLGACSSAVATATDSKGRGSANTPCSSEAAVQTSWRPHTSYPGLEERYIDVDGARLWATDTGGDGEAIVLLHAHTGSAMNWGYQQQFFAEKGFRVIAYSRRGYYRSGVDGTEAIGGMASASADLLAILEAFELEKIHLLGTAAGGMVAADFALSHQNRLQTLIIACSLVGISDEDYVAGTRRLLPKEFHALPPEYKELSADYILANPAGVAQWRALEQISKPDPSLFDFARFRASANRITSDKLKTLTVPTLIISGDSDQYFPQSRAKKVAALFENGRYHLLPQSSHSPFWEQYEPFNQTLLEFIA